MQYLIFLGAVDADVLGSAKIANLRLKLFVIGTFILFLKIEMYACRTFWLSCFFIKDIDNATYTVGIAFQRGKRPVLLWQSRLKKMSSASGYERNGV